jgi:hypothetical protein
LAADFAFELRACSSLTRLWQKQDKRAEAKRLLGIIYSCFSEGFETADLKEAAALQVELSWNLICQHLSIRLRTEIEARYVTA